MIRKLAITSCALLAIAMLLGAACTGCGGSKSSAVGTYIHDTNTADSLQLKGSGAFTLIEGGNTVSGTFKQEGDNITLRASNPSGLSSATALRLKSDWHFLPVIGNTAQNNVLVDPDGQRWVKK